MSWEFDTFARQREFEVCEVGRKNAGWDARRWPEEGKGDEPQLLRTHLVVSTPKIE